MRVLVDTSVWVAHWRAHNAALAALLQADGTLMHPMVLGEIACGTPPQRATSLAALADLRPAHQATPSETLALIERHTLYGQGLGWVDCTLLASTLITPAARLWTLDARLAAQAQRLGVGYQPALPAPH